MKMKATVDAGHVGDVRHGTPLPCTRTYIEMEVEVEVDGKRIVYKRKTKAVRFDQLPQLH